MAPASAPAPAPNSEEPGSLLKEYKAAGYPRPKASTRATERSDVAIRNASYQVERAQAALWGVAAKAPLFKKRKKQKRDAQGNLIPFPVNKDGSIRSTVANRAISAHTIRSLASGAAAAVAARIQSDATLLRLDTDAESQRFPSMPSISEGAATIFTNALVAYSHEAFGAAKLMKDTLGKHQKLTHRSVAAGCNVVNRKLAASTSFVPASIHYAAKKRTGKRRTRTRQGEKAAPAQGEENAD